MFLCHLVSERLWVKAVLLGRTILRRVSPSLAAEADSIDFEMESKVLLERMEEHVERMAEFVDHVDAQSKKAQKWLKGARTDLIIKREAHIDRLAKAVMGIPEDEPLPDPTKKYEVIGRAVRGWRLSKGLDNVALQEAVRIHNEAQEDVPEVVVVDDRASNNNSSNNNNKKKSGGKKTAITSSSNNVASGSGGMTALRTRSYSLRSAKSPPIGCVANNSSNSTVAMDDVVG